MQDAETVLNVIRERGERGFWRTSIGCFTTGTCTCGPTVASTQTRELRPRASPQRPWTVCHWGKSTASSKPCATSGSGGHRCDGSTFPNQMGELVPWAYHVDGQAAARGHPDDSGSLLRTAVLRPLPRLSARPACHTALSNVVDYWSGVRWFVEGDIKGCFDNIDHEVMLSVLGEKLHDNRFLRLLKYLLKAGYVEDWKYGRTLSGTPQGGIVSPSPRQHLPRPVGQVCRERADTSPHPRHRAERQPRVHTVAEPSGPPEETGEPRQGTATAQANATTAVTRPLRPRLPPVTVRTLRGRLRAGLHRDKGRSPTGKRVLGVRDSLKLELSRGKLS